MNLGCEADSWPQSRQSADLRKYPGSRLGGDHRQAGPPYCGRFCWRGDGSAQQPHGTLPAQGSVDREAMRSEALHGSPKDRWEQHRDEGREQVGDLRWRRCPMVPCRSSRKQRHQALKECRMEREQRQLCHSARLRSLSDQRCACGTCSARQAGAGPRRGTVADSERAGGGASGTGHDGFPPEVFLSPWPWPAPSLRCCLCFTAACPRAPTGHGRSDGPCRRTDRASQKSWRRCRIRSWPGWIDDRKPSHPGTEYRYS